MKAQAKSKKRKRAMEDKRDNQSAGATLPRPLVSRYQSISMRGVVSSPLGANPARDAWLKSLWAKRESEKTEAMPR